MNKTLDVFTIFSLLIIFILSGCNLGQASVDVSKTAESMVAATMDSEKNMQSTIDSAISLTSTAMAGPGSVTPTPDGKYYEMSEEELAALIDQSVNDALSASETAYTTTTQASADSSLSDEEIAAIEMATQDAEALIYEVDQMINAYYDLYGLYATATIETLEALEQDLESIYGCLQSIDQIMVQGAQAATTAINNINNNLNTIHENLTASQENHKEWLNQVKTELDNREHDILNIQPNEIATDRAGALESLKKYTEGLKSAVTDRKISPEELKNIGQLGANASASINKAGGGQLMDLSDQINNMTKLAARGNVPQVNKGLPELDRSIQRRR